MVLIKNVVASFHCLIFFWVFVFSSYSTLDFRHTLESGFVPALHEGRSLISRKWPVREPILCSLRKALVSNSSADYDLTSLPEGQLFLVYFQQA